MIYLDAHWGARLRLFARELELIDRNFNSWIVIIDDFKVPGMWTIEFDDYGPGQVLDIEYVNGCDIRRVLAFFNRTG